MKTSNKILTGFFLALFLIAVSTMAFVRANTTAQDPIEAMGERTTRTENISFKKLKMLDISVGNVTLVQGEPKIEITCAENIHEFLRKSYDHSNGLYQIGLKSGNFNRLNVEIKISANDLKSITLSHSTNLFAEREMSFKEIDLFIHNSSQLELPISAEVINLKSTDGTRINLKGKVNKLNATVNNSGRVEALDLVSKNTIADVSDGGRLTITTEEELSVTLSNAGVLEYLGNPEIKRQRISDGGRLNKLDGAN